MSDNGTIQERLGMFEAWATAARGDVPMMPSRCLEEQMSTKTRRIWHNLEATYIGQMIRRDWNSDETPVSMKCDIVQLVLEIEKSIARWESDNPSTDCWQRFGPQDQSAIETWPDDYRCRFKDSNENQCYHAAEWMPVNGMQRDSDVYDNVYYRCTRHMPMGATSAALDRSSWSDRRTLEGRARRFATSSVEALEWDEWARSINEPAKRRRSDWRGPEQINVPLFKKPGPKNKRKARA